MNRSYQERTKYDQSLKQSISETEDLKKNLAQTRISLNEEKRRKEMEEAERKKAMNKEMSTRLNANDGLAEDDLGKLKDEYLREGLLILSDLVTKRIG